MKKGKKLLLSIIIIIIISLAIAYVLKSKSQNINKIDSGITEMEDIAINHETGIINNEYFGIDKYGNNPSTTRKGINDALIYAKDKKINNVKLENGIYKVDTEVVGGYQKSIILQSNINFDLNGSTILIENNNQTNYGIISIHGLENVSVSNGIIVGEREGHTYEGKSTHEWGMGVDIRGSNNVNIYGLEIYDTTGDGVYISHVGGVASTNVNVSNCNIYNCRRQGISVITADGVKIYNNEIHHINGTIPQAGIDLEKNKEGQIIANIYIYENKFHSQVNPYCIVIWSNVENVYIENNEFLGDIRINEKTNENNETIFIGENKHIGNYPVTFYGEDTDLTDTFIDENLKQAILKLVGKYSTDSIYESDIAKIASDNVAGGKQLNLANKGIKKLDGIEIFAKYNLEWLYLDNNEIEDLTPISNIVSLTKLNANNNKIENLDALSKLTKLETVSLINNNISDISALSNMSNLKYLYVKKNNITSLSALLNNAVIKEIYSADNKIETIDNLLIGNSIEKLDVKKNKIKNLLSAPANLEYFDISENSISDVTVLLNTNIKTLNFSKQNIEYSCLQTFGTEYIRIDLPKIFSIYKEGYEVKVFGLSNYYYNNDYIVVHAKEFNDGGFSIKIIKDDIEYLSYKMNIDNSIIEGISTKFKVISTSDQLLVSGIDITNIKIEDFINKYDFDGKYTISFFKDGNSLDINNTASTGTIMRVFDAQKELYQDFTVVVYGDVNGDGNITSRDALSVISNKLSYDTKLDGAYLQSAKITNNSKTNNTMPSALDALAIIKHKLKIENITQN